MTQGIFDIISNRRIASGIYEMRMRGDVSALKAPGQFVNMRLAGKYLRRPISVCAYDDASLTILYKTVGDGTRQLSRMAHGGKLDLLVGLGNGFDTSKSGGAPLLIGGGIGAAPLYGLCAKLKEEGKKITVALGFNSESDAYYLDAFRALGASVLIATRDGSVGRRGFVTELVPELTYTYFYTCGPMAMLESVNKAVCTDGQLSFEERMGCGFGACMGCSCKTLTGSKRICRDGPVLERGEILWPTQE